MRPYSYQRTCLFPLITIIFVSAACQPQPKIGAVTPSAISSTPAAVSTSTPVTLTDSTSMKIGRVIPLGEESFPFGLAFARKSLWVLMRQPSFLPDTNLPGSILQIDPVNGQIVGEPIQIDFDPWSFAVTEDAIWVAKNGPAAVLHIDPETQQVLATIDVDASLVAADVHGVWVSSFGENANSASRVDPVTNRLVGTPIPVGIEPLEMVAGAGAVWVGAHSGPPGITRIDAETGKVLATIEVGFGIHGLAAGPDSLWAVDYHGQQVVRISPQTNQIVGKHIPLPFPPEAAAASATDVWVGVADHHLADPRDDRVVRIDLHSNTIVDTIHVGGHTIAMVYADHSLWVATVNPNLLVQILPQSFATPTP